MNLKRLIKEEVQSVLREMQKYKIIDFPVGAIIQFRDGDEWTVVGTKTMGNKVQVKPYNTSAKKNNPNIAVDMNIDYLNKNGVTIVKK